MRSNLSGEVHAAYPETLHHRRLLKQWRSQALDLEHYPGLFLLSTRWVQLCTARLHSAALCFGVLLSLEIGVWRKPRFLEFAV